MATISNQRAERIARNINAMDTYYQYSDDMKVWRFWNELKSKLHNIINGLSKEDINTIVGLCKEEKAKYFGLV